MVLLTQEMYNNYELTITSNFCGTQIWQYNIPEQRVQFYIHISSQQNDTILFKTINDWSYKRKVKHFIHMIDYTTNVRQKEKTSNTKKE